MRLRTVDTRGMRREFRSEQVERPATRLAVTMAEHVGELVAAKPTERGALILLPSLREQVRRQFVEARTGST